MLSRISVVNLGLSLFAFVCVLSIMLGMNRGQEERLVAVEPHLTIETDGLDEENLQSMLQQFSSKIQHQGEFEKQDLILRTLSGQFRGVEAYGVTAETFRLMNEKMNQLRELEGKRKDKSVVVLENFIPANPAEQEVIVGYDLALILEVYSGDEITFFQPELFLGLDDAPKIEKVRVKSILTTQISDLDSNRVYYLKDKTLSRFKQGASRIAGIEIWMKGQSLAEQFKRDLIKKGIPAAKIKTWRESNSSLFFALKLERFAIGTFLFLAALISSFSLITVMILLISLKRKDIAIMKTIGFTDVSVLKIFTFCGIFLGLFGVLPGVFFGSLVSLYLEYFPIQILPDIYYDSSIPSELNLGFVISVFFAALLMVFVASFLSARKSLEVTPSEVFKRG
ncbi:MAG: ABC transporter permease [Pseudobdellovibrionaceae bacterium]